MDTQELQRMRAVEDDVTALLARQAAHDADLVSAAKQLATLQDLFADALRRTEETEERAAAVCAQVAALTGQHAARASGEARADAAALAPERQAAEAQGARMAETAKSPRAETTSAQGLVAQPSSASPQDDAPDMSAGAARDTLAPAAAATTALAPTDTPSAAMPHHLAAGEAAPATTQAPAEHHQPEQRQGQRCGAAAAPLPAAQEPAVALQDAPVLGTSSCGASGGGASGGGASGGGASGGDILSLESAPAQSLAVVVGSEEAAQAAPGPDAAAAGDCGLPLCQVVAQSLREPREEAGPLATEQGSNEARAPCVGAAPGASMPRTGGGSDADRHVLPTLRADAGQHGAASAAQRTSEQQQAPEPVEDEVTALLARQAAHEADLVSAAKQLATLQDLFADTRRRIEEADQRAAAVCAQVAALTGQHAVRASGEARADAAALAPERQAAEAQGAHLAETAKSPRAETTSAQGLVAQPSSASPQDDAPDMSAGAARDTLAPAAAATTALAPTDTPSAAMPHHLAAGEAAPATTQAPAEHHQPEQRQGQRCGAAAAPLPAAQEPAVALQDAPVLGTSSCGASGGGASGGGASGGGASGGDILSLESAPAQSLAVVVGSEEAAQAAPGPDAAAAGDCGLPLCQVVAQSLREPREEAGPLATEQGSNEARAPCVGAAPGASMPRTGGGSDADRHVLPTLRADAGQHGAASAAQRTSEQQQAPEPVEAQQAPQAMEQEPTLPQQPSQPFAFGGGQVAPVAGTTTRIRAMRRGTSTSGSRSGRMSGRGSAAASTSATAGASASAGASTSSIAGASAGASTGTSAGASEGASAGASTSTSAGTIASASTGTSAGASAGASAGQVAPVVGTRTRVRAIRHGTCTNGSSNASAGAGTSASASTSTTLTASQAAAQPAATPQPEAGGDAPGRVHMLTRKEQMQRMQQMQQQLFQQQRVQQTHQQAAQQQQEAAGAEPRALAAPQAAAQPVVAAAADVLPSGAELAAILRGQLTSGPQARTEAQPQQAARPQFVLPPLPPCLSALLSDARTAGNHAAPRAAQLTPPQQQALLPPPPPQQQDLERPGGE
jgi:hypothetical protein